MNNKESKKAGCRLSPSTLNLMEDCPRCFWLSIMKKVKRPQGPMASIAIAMDSILKHYFDHFREKNQLPPLIAGKIKGLLPKEMPKTLRYSNGNGIELSGKPDEYFQLPTGEIVPFDHKTKSKPPENIHKAYQLQMDVYSFLLRENKYKTTSKAYLAYYCPAKSMIHDGMEVNAHIIEVKTNPDRAFVLLKKAEKIISSAEEAPQPSSECLFCIWAKGIASDY